MYHYVTPEVCDKPYTDHNQCLWHFATLSSDILGLGEYVKGAFVQSKCSNLSYPRNIATSSLLLIYPTLEMLPTLSYIKRSRCNRQH